MPKGSGAQGPKSPSKADLRRATARGNIDTLRERGRDAKADGFHIEAIIARQYILEGLLRAFIIVHAGKDPRPEATFEHLIDVAAACHLSRGVVKRLHDFRRTRNKAVHELQIGKISYADLGDVFDEKSKLPDDLQAEVRRRLEKDFPEYVEPGNPSNG